MLPECLRGIVDGKCLTFPDAVGTVVMEEKDVMEVEVVGFPQDAIIMQINQCLGAWAGIKKGPWKRLCDYMMIYHIEGKDYVVLIELKKTINEDDKGMEQLRWSLPVLDYLYSICRVKLNTSANTKKSFQAVQYVLIGKKGPDRLDKQYVKPNMSFSQVSYRGININLCLRSRIDFTEFVNLHHG